MHITQSAAIAAALLLLALPACHSTNTDTPPDVVGSVRGSPPDHAPASDQLRLREAERAAAHLDALITLDRQAVETGEQQVKQMRSLADAGRVSGPDLQTAELELLALRQTLLRHEQELAELRDPRAR